MTDQIHEHTEITVETLSTPPVEIAPAPLLRRVTAGLVDSSILGLLWYVMGIALRTQISVFYPIFPISTAGVYLGLLAFFYYFFLEGMFGATVGKFLLKLQVVEKDGDPCSFGASFTRNLLRFLDWLPVFYVLGSISILTSRKRQRIGDRVARTFVSPAPEKDINPPPAPFLFH